MKTREKMKQVMNQASAIAGEGGAKLHSGMSYEEGVEAALRWALDDTGDETGPLD